MLWTEGPPTLNKSFYSINIYINLCDNYISLTFNNIFYRLYKESIEQLFDSDEFINSKNVTIIKQQPRIVYNGKLYYSFNDFNAFMTLLPTDTHIVIYVYKNHDELLYLMHLHPHLHTQTKPIIYK